MHKITSSLSLNIKRGLLLSAALLLSGISTLVLTTQKVEAATLTINTPTNGQ